MMICALKRHTGLRFHQWRGKFSRLPSIFFFTGFKWKYKQIWVSPIIAIFNYHLNTETWKLGPTTLLRPFLFSNSILKRHKIFSQKIVSVLIPYERFPTKWIRKSHFIQLLHWKQFAWIFLSLCVEQTVILGQCRLICEYVFIEIYDLILPFEHLRNFYEVCYRRIFI